MKTIVIAQRGRVLVGDMEMDTDLVVLKNCSCIRRWGTTAGLGELGFKGPTKETVLDPQPTTRLHILTTVEMIEAPGWK